MSATKADTAAKPADETTTKPEQLSSLAERTPSPSPAGPVDDNHPTRMPPAREGSRLAQSIRFVFNPLGTSLSAYRRFGDVWQVGLLTRDEPFIVTCHPDHVKSLFKAKPDEAPSLTGESPLRPVLGPNSVLTSVGERHMRQRKLLLPAFHGDAVQRYVQTIEEVAAREIEGWETGKRFALAPRMQAVTLDVIMAGVFGIGGKPARGSVERRLRQTIRNMLLASTNPLYQLVELQQAGRHEPRGLLRLMRRIVDPQFFALIRQRREAGPDESQHDVLSLLVQARDEEGQLLTDQEVRDELLTLVLAGHETTANQLAWTFERLVRNPEAYDTLRQLVRSGDEQADAYVEATIYEGMRIRPVIPMIVRMVKRRWQLGDYVLPPNTPVGMSIVALHHREDVYPEPHTFRPERFIENKPGTYTWIPFGGGIRRCLGAALAMAEQKVVLKAIAERVDLAAPTPKREHPQQRNVTMIPRRGGRVVVERKLA
jgi:cytochrome P450